MIITLFMTGQFCVVVVVCKLAGKTVAESSCEPRRASLSVRPSVRVEQNDSHRTTFPEIPLLAFLVIFVNTLRLRLKSDKNNGHSA